MRILSTLLVSTAMLAACGSPASGPDANAQAATPDDGVMQVKLTQIVADTEFAWGLAFLPNGDLLFTEKDRGLKFVAGGEGAAVEVAGVPEAFVERQGGYLGLTLDPAFETNRLVYIAYSKGDASANGAAVVKGRLSDDASTLEDVTEIFWADRRDTAFHYGARIQFEDADTMFVSLGEGYKFMQDSQDPKNTHGTIVRINSDGSIPEDNPFADGADGAPAVWSYGHRNVQGLYYDGASKTLFATEHGPKGGDEFNIVEAGKNYGWPKITYGVDYDGTIITKKTEAEGMEQPLHYWVPSIAPAGLVRLTSDVYPDWKGDLFTGGMNGPAGQKLVRLDMDGNTFKGTQEYFDGEYPIRDVVQGPDGHLYVATMELEGIFRVDVVN